MTEKYKLTLIVKDALRGKRLQKITSSFLVLIILLTLLIGISNASTPQTVTTEDMKNYAQAVLNNYNKQIEYYFSTSTGNFSFYQKQPYAIKYYHSSLYGAALSFEPSSTSSFQEIGTDQRIELAVFGGDWNNTALAGWDYVRNFLLRDQILTNWGGPLLRLGHESNGIVMNETINGIIHNLVIIKSSNATTAWTIDLAIQDSNIILDTDTGKVFVSSPSVEAQIVYRYSPDKVLYDKAREIQYNLLHNDSYQLDFYRDYAQLEDMAVNQFHLENATGILNQILSLANMKLTGILPLFPTPTPTPMPSPIPITQILWAKFDDPSNWIWAISLSGFIFMSYILLLKAVDNGVKKKTPHTIVFAGATALMGILVTDLAHQPPSNLEVISLPSLFVIAVVVLIVLIGVFSYFDKRKKPSGQISVRNRNKQTHQEQTNEIPKKGVGIKKPKGKTNKKNS